MPPTINPQPPILLARHEDSSETPVAMADDRPAVITLASAATSGTSVFPDLAGLSARDALRVLGKLGVTGRLRGSGLVVQQEPAAGSPLDSGDAVTLWLQRQLIRPSTSSPADTTAP